MNDNSVKEQHIYVIDIDLCSTPWWDTHKYNIPTWYSVQTAMIHRFVLLPKFNCSNISRKKIQEDIVVEIYNVETNHIVYMEHCTEQWKKERI